MGFDITPDVFKKLTDEEKAGPYPFTSKEGKDFSAYILLNEVFEVKFEFPSARCPSCGKEMRLNDYGAFCDCGLKIFKNQRGIKLTDKAIAKLLSGEEVVSSNFKKKGEDGKYNGSKYSGKLYIKDGELKFELLPKAGTKSASGNKSRTSKKSGKSKGTPAEGIDISNLSLEDFYNELIKGK